MISLHYIHYTALSANIYTKKSICFRNDVSDVSRRSEEVKQSQSSFMTASHRLSDSSGSPCDRSSLLHPE